MQFFRHASALSCAVLFSLAGLAATPQSALAQAVAQAPAAPAQVIDGAAFTTSAQWANEVWKAARNNDLAAVRALIDRFTPPDSATPTELRLAEAARSLREHIAQRETARTERIAEVRAEIEKARADGDGEIALAKSMRSLIELHMIALDKDAALADPMVKDVVTKSEFAAHAAEKRGDAVVAGELFMLLDALMDIPGTYKQDVRRIIQRQEMMRLYTPEHLYELRKARQLADAPERPVAPYNPYGENFRERLATVDQTMIERAMAYARRHVEQIPLNEVVRAGLETLRTMVSTKDLSKAFPELANPEAVGVFDGFLGREIDAITKRAEPLDAMQISQLLDRVRRQNDTTVRLPNEALFHEFGNGAFGRLDEFSSIIWPDEVRRFEKNTKAQFVGIGVSIEYDELLNVRVVTPLEGTPAQRAGIHRGDVIKAVGGRPILGLTLDQAVELITGPRGTKVMLTLERKVEKKGDKAAAEELETKNTEATPEAKADAKEEKPEVTEVNLEVERDIIAVSTVKGWKRSGVREDDWEWFIDKDSSIGYVRLSQFSDSSDRELTRAIRDMKREGLSALIFDLRFNPGGLLDQAVKVAQRFIDVKGGFVVMNQGPGGVIESPERTNPERALLAGIPIVVLVNEGSASASEIVSGAIATYARQNTIDAIVLGARSYGKGSVQNVWPLTATSMTKVTTAYYLLPDRSIIHRRPGATKWGVEPDLLVEMLPKQNADALNLRRNADIVTLNENGRVDGEVSPNPEDLIAKGTDLQLETALFLLRARVAAKAHETQGEPVPGSAMK